jgi:acid phosphatase (class A)
MKLSKRDWRCTNGTNSVFRHLFTAALIALCLGLLPGCAALTPSLIPATVPEVRPGILQPFLPPAKAPNSSTLLPAPPAKESAAFAADEEAFRLTRQLVNTPRWTQAAEDANLHFPRAPQAFSCALDAPITKEAMPNLYTLMHRALSDAGLATFAAKKKYQRTRPFIFNKETSCTPAEEAELARDGSYPSGHSSIGWTWTLILAEIAPDRADAILARGYAFGQSRVVCGVHWQSDVTAGRVIGAAVVAKLHSDPVFQAQLSAAKKELAAARAHGLEPAVDCKAEAAALAF